MKLHDNRYKDSCKLQWLKHHVISYDISETRINMNDMIFFIDLFKICIYSKTTLTHVHGHREIKTISL